MEHEVIGTSFELWNLSSQILQALPVLEPSNGENDHLESLKPGDPCTLGTLIVEAFKPWNTGTLTAMKPCNPGITLGAEHCNLGTTGSVMIRDDPCKRGTWDSCNEETWEAQERQKWTVNESFSQGMDGSYSCKGYASE